MDKNRLSMIVNMFENSNWKKRILWCLGILILVCFTPIILEEQSRWADSFSEMKRKEGWKEFSIYNSDIVDNSVLSIAFDEFGRSWIGTWDGVSVFDGESWLSYTTENSALEHTSAWADTIEVDLEGRIWIGLRGGTDEYIGGLIVADGELWEVYLEENSPLQGSVHTIAFDKTNRAWIGTDNGIQIIDGSDWISLNKNNSGLVDNIVTVIEFDESGRAWIGTVKGLSVYDGETWLSYTEENSNIMENYVRCIEFDQRGKVWIGVYGGVSVFDGESWTNNQWIVRDPGSVHPDTVHAITKDTHGHILFISTSALRIYDGNLWMEYNSENSGFPNTTADDIAIDPQGNIWIATNWGVYVVSVDSSGLPRDVPQKTSQDNKSIFKNINVDYLYIPITILCFLLFAVLLDDIFLIVVGFVIGFVLITYNIDHSYLGNNLYLPDYPMFPVISSIVGSFIRKFRKKASLIPTILGFIIGLVLRFLFLLVQGFMMT